jgi:aldehyde:ferredoxin oxidoreductase
VTEGPDYAQLASLGSNCGVADLTALGYMNHLCYELGLDPIEIGNTLAMVAELSEVGVLSGGLHWGDVDRMIDLITLTGLQQGIGAILSLGASQAAQKLGAQQLAMAVKGISVQNVDPRPEPAWGLLNATESFGGAAHIWAYADLVSGMRAAGIQPLVGPHSTVRELAESVRYRQDLVAVLDSLTSCAFSSYAFSLDDYAEAMTLTTGEPFTPAILMAAGDRIVGLERRYNRTNGFTRKDDVLPTRFTQQAVPDGVHAGKTCALEPMLHEYYAIRGREEFQILQSSAAPVARLP